MERIPREVPTHADVDLIKPVNLKQVMATDREQHGESCYSHLWQPDHAKCQICADNEICGILFHNRQKKAVKEMESRFPPMLDTTDFAALKKPELMMWLKIKPRKTSEFVKHINSIVNCADVETLQWWAKSFIIDNPKLSVVDSYIIVSK